LADLARWLVADCDVERNGRMPEVANTDPCSGLVVPNSR